jgi:hypothetical protein
MSRRLVRVSIWGSSGVIAVAFRSCLIAALSVGIPGFAQADTWLYRVAFDPADPLVARVVVELPAPRRAQDFSVQVRGLAEGLMPQVADLRCDGAPLAPDSASAWLVQGWSCVRLTWTVPVREVSESGIDPRARETVFDGNGRFWLFSEAASLLRPVGEAAHDGRIEFSNGGPVHGGSQAGEPMLRVVPPQDGPPEYWAIGRLPGASLTEGRFEVVHLDALGVGWQRLLAEHGRALRYLTRAAGERQLAPLRTTVVWLAGPTEDGAPVGVAGHRTLLLSAARSGDRLLHAELALAWLLREQLLRSMPPRVPAWARESLAQYYAVRALRRTELPADAVAAAERRLIEPLRPLQLREAQRQAQTGDARALAELRSVGAAFWDRIDRAIVRKSGFRTIDSMLPRLLAADWPEGRLPPSAVERLHEYASAGTIDELLAQHVGD